MSLPSLTLPASLPMWQVNGYEAAPGAVYAHAAMSTGHSRTRRVYSVAERAEKASMLLTGAQLATWHDFYENSLQAGALPFSAQFANLGPGTRWFDALMVGEYTSTPHPGGMTTVSCTLALRGSPSLTGP